MTELEVLQQIQVVLESLLYVSGVVVSLMLVILFAKAWGRSSNV